jgi:hypothetical protein
MPLRLAMISLSPRCGRWLVFAAALTLTGALGGACSTFEALSRAPADAGAPDARDTSSCASDQVPPARPQVPPQGGALDLVFASYSIDFGSGVDDAGHPRYESMGYDIACSDNDGGPTCTEPAWANAPDDLVRGIDNAADQYSWRYASKYMLPRWTFDGAAGSAPAVIFRVTGFSGGQDDDQITVSVYVGLQVEPRDNDGGTLDSDAAGAPMARWDGRDRWILHPDMLVSSADGGQNVDQPKYRDDHAYVSHGILVAHFPELLRPAGLLSMPSVLSVSTRAIVTGHLVQTSDGSWEIENGITEERDPLTETLRIFARDPPLGNLSGSYACQSAVTYKTLWMELCPYADVSSRADGLSSPCDALSFGSSWTAKPAILGTIASLPPVTLPPCAPCIHPDTDTCESLESDADSCASPEDP